MTSKEALLKFCFKNLQMDDDGFYLLLDEEGEELLEVIQKDLEVLEIIKNKLVFPLALMSLPYELYNNSVIKEQQLTQEEYDKIKGWLKNDK